MNCFTTETIRTDLLRNYFRLIESIDARCREIQRGYSDHLACRRGCADCCRSFSIFPVEAAAILHGIETLPAERYERILDRSRSHGQTDQCSLLENGECLIYPFRPIICRTHGFPILTRANGDPEVDFCPKNFTRIASLPGNAMIDIDRLNETLVAVNRLFISEWNAGGTALDRIALHDIFGFWSSSTDQIKEPIDP